MKKLWDKGYQLDKKVEDFTVGEDIHYDKKLIPYDCLGSMAHAAMLKKIGILSAEEFKQLHSGLRDIISMAKEGKFSISPSDEDVHTAVEIFLTNQCGEAGKKLHTARSRNDQVAVDMRLYVKQQLLTLGFSLLHLCEVLIQFAQKHQKVAIPGRTHMQRAMPSSFGLWAGAFLEAILDDLFLIQQAYILNDQCPLGSAASYGTAIATNRQYTADLLGFSKVQNNVLYANNSRGKLESVAVHAAAQAMTNLSRISSDLILFSIPEFGYITLPKEYCSGSSLMPQKHNPDVLELVRAKTVSVTGYLHSLLEIIRPLPSGYSRDLQETKKPVMDALDIAQSSVSIVAHTLQGIKVNKSKCLASFTSELFATDVVLKLVESGMPFREAYKKVGNEIHDVEMQDPVDNIMSKTHMGSTGNLGLSIAKKDMYKFKQWLLQENEKWETTINHLNNIEELIK